MLLILGLLISLTVTGQRHDNLRPLSHETTDIGKSYRTYYSKLTVGLSRYPKARTFGRTWFPELTSIEETENKTYTLFYRGFKERFIKDSDGDTTGIKKPKDIIKFEKIIDSLLVKTLQELFKKAIYKTSYGEREVVIIQPTFYYFYTWVVGEGIICGTSEIGLMLPRTDRLIGLHEKLVEYAKSFDTSEKLRLEIIKEAESLIKEYD
jgi:hypothetical protein